MIAIIFSGSFVFEQVANSGTGFLFWNLATKWIGAVRTSVYIYVSPVVTVILSVFILHEKMTPVSVAGALLILVGLIISQRKKRTGPETKTLHDTAVKTRAE